MPEERFLTIQLHEMLTYLGQAGVATLLIAAQRGLVGSQMSSPIDASYLADSVILLRYYEAMGEVRQAISIVKKRAGEHEKSIRPLTMKGGQLQIGPPLQEFRGILTGVPVFDSSSTQARGGDPL